MMNPLKLRFMKEKYEKEAKFLRFQEEFIAVPGMVPVSGKFYSKSDALSPDEAPEEYVKLVRRCATSTPKDNFTYQPPCVNMDYGWFNQRLIPRPDDSRLIFPIKESEFIKTAIYINEMQKKTNVGQKKRRKSSNA